MADEKIGPLTIAGSTGLIQHNGYVREEWHPKLSGTQAVKVYREISDNDAVAGSMLYGIESLICQAPWDIDPANESQRAQELADFLDSAIKDMSHTWQAFLVEVLSKLIYGWSYFEIVYKVRRGNHLLPEFRSQHDDGLYGWRKFSIRSQESLEKWEFDQDGGIKGMHQRPAPTYDHRYVPLDKALLFRNRAQKNNPEGRSVLRNAYLSWYQGSNIENLESIGVEKDHVGTPIMELPVEMCQSNADATVKAQRDEYNKSLQRMQRNEYEGVTIPTELDREGKPTGYKFRLQGSPGQRQFDTDKIVRRHQQRMSGGVMGQFLLTGQDKPGSYSMHSNQTNLFGLATGSIMDEIEETFNRHAVSRLMEINGFTDRENWPSIRHGDIEKEDLSGLATYITATQGYIVPDDKLERWLRERADMPMPDAETAREPVEPAPDDGSDPFAGLLGD